MTTSISRQIANELGVRDQQVEATVALLDGGATVPFIARYRKEATGALDDAQLRTLEERLNYLRELEERRTAILNSIREQGKLDAALETAIFAADSKGRLEDIYLPFKPKRRTKARSPRKPAWSRWPTCCWRTRRTSRRRPPPLSSTPTSKCRTPPPRSTVRAPFWSSGSPRTPTSSARCASRCGRAAASPRKSATARRSRRQIQRLFRFRRSPHEAAVAPHPGAVPRREGGGPRPHHRAGESGDGAAGSRAPTNCASCTASASPTAAVRATIGCIETARWAWRTKILVHLAVDLRLRLWNAAEQEAVRVFAANLRDLLLAAPAGRARRRWVSIRAFAPA